MAPMQICSRARSIAEVVKLVAETVISSSPKQKMAE